jgi:ribonuclease P/MRP protein subunit RPP1
MKLTDACVFPYPNGNTSVRRMALEARSLGFDSIVAVDTAGGEYGGVQVIPGIHIRDAPVREVINRVKRERGKGAVVSVQAGDTGFNRAAIGIKGMHILRGIQSCDKTAFDHVSAKMATDNRVAIDLDISPVITGRGISRQRVLHRYRDILVLQNRFEFPVTISSHARSCLDMRAVREISGLCSLLGMDVEMVGSALASVEAIMAPSVSAVEVIG